MDGHPKSAAALAALAAVFAFSACSSGSDKASPATETPIESEAPALTDAPTATASDTTFASETTEAPPTTDASPVTAAPTTTLPMVDPLDYFEAIFNEDLSDPPALYADAEPGSPAAAYGAHQVNVRLVDRDAGLRPEDLAVTSDGETVSVCDPPVAQAGECTIYGGFVNDIDGLLYTFTVDSVSIDDRLGSETPGQQRSSPVVGAGVRVMSSYRSVADDDLFVVVELTAVLRTELSLPEATYVDPTGRQVEVSSATGPRTLREGTRAFALLVFAQSDPGGQLFIEMFSPNFSNSEELSIEVPAATFG